MDTMIQRRSTQFNMRMDPDLKEVAEQAAVLERRSLSALVEWLLVEHCKKVGLLGPDGRLPAKKKGGR